MPGRLKVRVLAGRNLPVMDRASELTDAFVEIRFGTIVHKTEVFHKSLSPQWSSEWFKFEVEDEELQDEHLQLRVLDHDTYTAHDAIGKVYIDLDPLLTKDDGPNVISGWFPIYDTMHGIRGELNVIVKVDLFTDVNKFRQSSCGVQFYNAMGVPSGFRAQYLHGFVEELVVNDDPEYAWIDHIRTPRSSNEARQTLFMTLSGELRRRIGLKVLEMGGNSVIGYIQCFDLEGESGIVVRGIGTVAFLNKIGAPMASPMAMSSSVHFQPFHLARRSPDHSSPSSPRHFSHQAYSPTSSLKFHFPPSSPVTDDAGSTKTTPPLSTIIYEHPLGQLPESEIGSPPKGGSIEEGSVESGQNLLNKPVLGDCTKSPKSIEMMEFPFFTMHTFPYCFITSLGGMVTARSVKLLDKINNPDEPEMRDTWWLELRTEIRSHMKTLGCHAVIGYTEQTSIWGEVIVLSATGTAALVNLNFDPDVVLVARPPANVIVALDRMFQDKDKLTVDVNLANQAAANIGNLSPPFACNVCHIPYKSTSPPFPVNITKCAICRKKRVSDILFTTIDPPVDLEAVGHGCIIQARICRSKRDMKGEAHAKEISDSLPFMEYELHNQLLTKLKMKGMNCLFGVTVQITVGDILLTAIATATAVFIASLPPPAVPKVTNQLATEQENKNLQDLQKTILNTVQRNKERYRLNSACEHMNQPSPRSATTDDSDDDDLIDLDFGFGNKETFILEVDDTRDDTIFSILQDCCPNTNFHLSNTQAVPGLSGLSHNLQMFTQVWRGTFSPSPSSTKISSELSRLCDKIIRRLLFRLRRLAPCCLCGLEFDLVIPDKDEIQLSVTGVCVALQEHLPTMHPDDMQAVSLKFKHATSEGVSHSVKEESQDDMIFPIDEVTQTVTNLGPKLVLDMNVDSSETIHNMTEPISSTNSLMATCCMNNIELTPLSYIPSAKIERYLGYYNFFFIRETTSLREEGGLGGFMQSFIYEILAVARANVSSMAGNALLSYHMSECVLMHNPHKNQAQCLINVCGDTVRVIHEGDLHHPTLMTIPEQSMASDSDYS